MKHKFYPDGLTFEGTFQYSLETKSYHIIGGITKDLGELMVKAPELFQALKDVLPFAERYCSQNGIDPNLHCKLAHDVIKQLEG